VLAARAFAARGFSVLRFDYRGMGDSDGEVRAFDDVSADIRAALECLLTRQPQISRVVLYGLCDGASAALMYMGTDRRISGVIIANPWVRTVAGEAKTYLRHYYLQRLLQGSFWRRLLTGRFNPVKSASDLASSVAAASRGGGESASAGGRYVERMLTGMRSSAAPVLVLISERDLTAKEFSDLCASDAHWRSAMADQRVRTINLAGADHTFSNRAALDSANEQCVRWLEQLATP
jgi:exosortase A-associated hydrolase 1